MQRTQFSDLFMGINMKALLKRCFDMQRKMHSLSKGNCVIIKINQLVQAAAILPFLDWFKASKYIIHSLQIPGIVINFRTHFVAFLKVQV